MRQYRWLMLLVVLIAGCAQLGLSSPRSVPEKLAYGYTSVTQVREATTNLLVTRQISVETAKKVRDLTNVARRGLDEARDLHYSGNGTKAGARLQSALKQIDEAQKLLKGGS